jgi:hypothetical protein
MIIILLKMGTKINSKLKLKSGEKRRVKITSETPCNKSRTIVPQWLEHDCEETGISTTNPSVLWAFHFPNVFPLIQEHCCTKFLEGLGVCPYGPTGVRSSHR